MDSAERIKSLSYASLAKFSASLYATSPDNAHKVTNGISSHRSSVRLIDDWCGDSELEPSRLDKKTKPPDSLQLYAKRLKFLAKAVNDDINGIESNILFPVAQ